MKSIGIVCLAAMLALPACATVEIAAGETPVAQAEIAPSKARIEMRRSAKTLSYKFAQNGWTAKTSRDDSQSAANILLRGLKSKATSPDVTKAYIAKTVSAADVLRDVNAAQAQVIIVTDMAQDFLSSNPDALNVRKDLKLLEKAMVSARKAEMTFAKALIAKGETNSEARLQSLGKAITALRDVTDAYGARQRGSEGTLQAG